MARDEKTHGNELLILKMNIHKLGGQCVLGVDIFIMRIHVVCLSIACHLQCDIRMTA